jgi:hypothetical protein
MSLSKNERMKNLEDSLLLLMDNVYEPQSIMEVFIDERFLDRRILPTTWTELKRCGLVRQCDTGSYFTLSGRGWLTALRLRGLLETPEMKATAGKLSAALKDRVKGRQCPDLVHVAEVANNAELSEAFVRNAIESRLIEELFGTIGADWAGFEDRGKFIEIPNDFGLSPLQ